MAWKGGARREGSGLPCPAWRWQFRFVLKFVVFSPPPRGGRTIYVTKLRYTLRSSASPPSPSPKEMSFPHRNRVEGGFGRKVGCGCLRSAWSGNVIIFGRDKAKIAFMDHQNIYRSRSLENLVLACRYFATVWDGISFSIRVIIDSICGKSYTILFISWNVRRFLRSRFM